MRPGVNPSILDSAPPLSLPTEDSIYLLGVTERGAVGPQKVTSFADWQAKYGVRNTASQTAWDSVDILFQEGAKRVYTSRVVSSTAVTASIAITDSGAATVFTVQAKQGPGVHGNDLNVVIRGNAQDPNIPAGSYRMRVQTDAAVILEESYDLIDKAAGLQWMDSVSTYIKLLTDGASANDPNNGTTFSLAGGTDGGAIVDADWQTATDLITADIGNGIVIAPGRTSDTGHTQIKNHAENRTRVAFMDSPDTPTIATVTASVAANRSRFAAMFWPFVRVRGLTPGTYRTVPPSVIAAGIAGRLISEGRSPNVAAAGALGISRTALSLTQDNTVITDANHQTLNAAGCNVIRSVYNGQQIRILGWRTTVSEAADPKWVNLGNARLTRAIQAAANLVGDRFLFREIDGQGILIAEFGGAMAGEVLMPYFQFGSLYGATPDEAFRVDTSANTDTTAQNRQLLANLIVVESEFAEQIDIPISKQLITEGV